jgi:hypothetical protein
MTSYSIHSLDDQGRVALSHAIRCRDDLDALSEGERRSVRHAVEIFHGSRLVARVKRGNAPLNTEDSHSL